VRLYNPTGENIRGTLTAGFPNGGAEAVNFREELMAPLEMSGNAFTLEVAPYEIMTVRILAGDENRDLPEPLVDK